uniref:Uncharacterized protein n=1 Tax=Rhizophora mucronata TaxID=61149 RepID=A0A2P2Q6Y6_RHIMU
MTYHIRPLLHNQKNLCQNLLVLLDCYIH